jgi:hypothetical protein
MKDTWCYLRAKGGGVVYHDPPFDVINFETAALGWTHCRNCRRQIHRDWPEQKWTHRRHVIAEWP